MTEYVFDTEPLIAYLYDEPGASAVTERLQAVDCGDVDAAISHATATELVYKIARLETGDPNQIQPGEANYEVGEEDLRVFRDYGLVIKTPHWQTVSRIKGAGGISLGDSYAAALAHDEEATLIVGADPEFADLPVGIDIMKIRDKSA
jgi:predicted nucleic acid-binding protein